MIKAGQLLVAGLALAEGYLGWLAVNDGRLAVGYLLSAEWATGAVLTINGGLALGVTNA